MRWSEKASAPVKMHKVVILDSSGSMMGDKYDSAKQGIKLDYESCKQEGFTDYLLVEFSVRVRKNLYSFNQPLVFEPEFQGTALYSTVYSTLNSILGTIPSDEKVLVQIFTDGQDTHSAGYRGQAREVIEQFNSKGWTVTFVGTKSDVAYVQSNLSIPDSNTLVHDNTPKGISLSFESYMDNQSTYTKSVTRGEDVTRGFFTKNISKNG
jgi:hypothetical protein